MKTCLLIIIILLSGIHTFCQFEIKHYVGINILQLPATTINVNYSIDSKPYLTPVVEIGYTLNYNYVSDISSYYFAMHHDILDGYTLSKQSGGYLKLGGFLKLRRSIDMPNFFHLGIFLSNSIVYEKGSYLNPHTQNPNVDLEEVEHTLFLIGLSTSLGYEFRITNRLKSNMGFQLSFPTKNFHDLYGIGNHIPGMGYCGSTKTWFPMLILNLKYKIK